MACFALFVASVVIAGVAGCRTDRDLRVVAPSPEERLERGLSLLHRSQGEEGARLLRETITDLEAKILRNPRSARYRLSLATAYYALGRIPAAISALEAAAALEPASFLVSYNLGQIHQVRGEHSTALRWFLRAARANPDDWRTNAKLVQTYQALGLTAEKERARLRLFDLRRSHGLDEVEFCREQFQDNGYDIRVFERFELEGQWAIRYRFEATRPGTPGMQYVLTLGSYRVTAELNTIGIGEYRNGPTENDLRRAQGLPLRGAYDLDGAP